MANRKRKYNRKKKRKKINKLLVLGGLAAAVLAAITVNTYYPFAEDFPDWDSVTAQVSGYFEAAPSPNKPVEGELSVHYIDVDQGSAVLVQSEAHAVLLDAGENNKGQLVVDYLKKQGVEKLDYAVASHPHSDHIGGMDVVLQNIPTDSIIMPQLKDSLVPTTKTYEDLIDAIVETDTNVIAGEHGAVYELGDMTMTLLGPMGDFNDLNNMSVGARINFGGTAFVYTADMEEEAEAALVKSGADLDADVYALGHHGSRTSNTNALLDKIGASYYVIQCGYNNSYGHPHKEALERANQTGGKIYRCDVSGTVVAKSDGRSVEIVTEK